MGYSLHLNGEEVPLGDLMRSGAVPGQLSWTGRKEGDDTRYYLAVSVVDRDATKPLHDRIAVDVWCTREGAPVAMAAPEERRLEVVILHDGMEVLEGFDVTKVWPGCGFSLHVGLGHRLLGSAEDLDAHPFGDFWRWYSARGTSSTTGLHDDAPDEVFAALLSQVEADDYHDTTARTAAQGSPRATWTDWGPALAWGLGATDEYFAFHRLRRWSEDQLRLRAIHWDNPEARFTDGVVPEYPYERRQGTSQVTTYDAQHFEADKVALTYALTGDPIAGFHALELYRTWRRYFEHRMANEVNPRALGWMLRGGAILSRLFGRWEADREMVIGVLFGMEQRPRLRPYPAVLVNHRAQRNAKDHDYMGTSPWMSSTIGIGALDWDLGDYVATIGEQIDLAYTISDEEDGTIPDDFDLDAWQGNAEGNDGLETYPADATYVRHHHVNDFGTYMTHATVRYFEALAMGQHTYVQGRLRVWAKRTPLLKVGDKNADYGLILRFAEILGGYRGVDA